MRPCANVRDICLSVQAYVPISDPIVTVSRETTRRFSQFGETVTLRSFPEPSLKVVTSGFSLRYM